MCPPPAATGRCLSRPAPSRDGAPPLSEVRRFLVAAARAGAVLELDGSDYHYLVRVRRVAPGAVIPVMDAAGRHAQATVAEVGAATVRLRMAAEAGAQVADRTGAAARLTLIQALPKGALMDRIVRQATELGVTAIVPMVAERSQGRVAGAAQTRRRQRWQRIARQAAQQSGSAVPVIEAPAPLRAILERRVGGDVPLLFLPGAAPLLPDRWIGAPPRDARELAGVSCAVGPEGGFSPQETELFRHRGFRPVGLPTGVLRVDTAAVAALAAAVQYFLA